MSSPLIFFVIIVVIDLVLKSMKDKKKAEQSRNRDGREKNVQNKSQTVQTSTPNKSNTIKELRNALEMEFENQKAKPENLDSRREQIPKPKTKEQHVVINKNNTRMESIEDQKQKINNNSETSKSQRLEREDTLDKARLSNNQVSLGQLSGRDNSLFNDSEKTINLNMETKKIGKRNVKSISYKKREFKEDILKGIIFSEILSEPKSIAKKRI